MHSYDFFSVITHSYDFSSVITRNYVTVFRNYGSQCDRSYGVITPQFDRNRTYGAADTFRHSIPFPSVRQLFLTDAAIYKFNIADLLIPLSKTLHDIHITFRRLTDKSSYFQIQ